MPRPRKKQKRKQNRPSKVASRDKTNYINLLSTDELAIIFGYLLPENIMLARLNKKMRDAAIKTIVPTPKHRDNSFRVDNSRKYNAWAAMKTALPNLQQIHISITSSLYSRNWSRYNIEILSRFRKLRELTIFGDLRNMDRCPFIFRDFPLLEKLHIYTPDLKWELDMLAGLPFLKDIKCLDNQNVTGNISSLRVLKNTLVAISFDECKKIKGNLMDLADFPNLRTLNLAVTAVTGDIRQIGEKDFVALESLQLPHRIYGGVGYKIQHISDALDLTGHIHDLLKQRPKLQLEHWFAYLSQRSPDWYEGQDDWHDLIQAPFYIVLVKAGSRLGWRWQDRTHGYLEPETEHNPCEVNWLDPEPSKDSNEYKQYKKELVEIEQRIDAFEGFYEEPPTEGEYWSIIRYEREHRDD